MYHTSKSLDLCVSFTLAVKLLDLCVQWNLVNPDASNPKTLASGHSEQNSQTVVLLFIWESMF